MAHWSVSELKSVEKYRANFQKKRIIDCLMRGMKNADIAKELQISERGVKAYIARLCDDYGVHCKTSHVKRISLAVAIHAAGDCPCHFCRISGRYA